MPQKDIKNINLTSHYCRSLSQNILISKSCFKVKINKDYVPLFDMIESIDMKAVKFCNLPNSDFSIWARRNMIRLFNRCQIKSLIFDKCRIKGCRMLEFIRQCNYLEEITIIHKNLDKEFVRMLYEMASKLKYLNVTFESDNIDYLYDIDYKFEQEVTLKKFK